MENNQQSLWGKIKNKISNCLNPKPKTFLLGNGEHLEINGKIPSSGIVGFFNNIGESLVNSTQKVLNTLKKPKIQNTPYIHSNSLIPSSPNREDTKYHGLGLLKQGNIEAPNKPIIPENVQDIPSQKPAAPLLRDNPSQQTPSIDTHIPIQLITHSTITNGIHNYSKETLRIIQQFRRSYNTTTKTSTFNT